MDDRKRLEEIHAIARGLAIGNAIGGFLALALMILAIVSVLAGAGQ